MSLINKVLKDVEKKHQQSENVQTKDKGVLSGLSSAPRIKTTGRWNVLALFIIALILTVLLVYSYWPLSFVQKLDIMPLPPVKKGAIQSKKPRQNIQSNKSLPKPAIINNQLLKVVLERKKTQNQIDFSFNHSVYYYIDHDNNHIQVTFVNTKAITPLALDTKNSMIKSAIFQQENKNLVMQLVLVPKTEVQSLDVVANQLHLVLYNADATDTEVMHRKDLPLTNKEKSDQFYSKAVRLLGQHHSDLAATELVHALAVYPEGKATRTLLVSLRLNQGDLWKAEEVLRQGFKFHSGYLPFIKMQARIFLEKHQLNKAIQVLEAKKPDLNQDPDYYVLLAALYRQDGQYQHAIEVYKNLTQMDSQVGIWWVGLGSSFAELNQLNLAKQAYSQALKCSDLSPQIKAYVTQQLSL